MGDPTPSLLKKDILTLKKTRGDGWCLYTALLYELHEELMGAGADISTTYNRWLNYAFVKKLVETVSESIRKGADMPKKTAGPAPALKYKEHMESTIQGLDYKDPDDASRPYTAENYLKNLIKFRGADINTGPVEWGDGKIVGDLFSALIGVGFNIYEDEGNPSSYGQRAISDDSVWESNARDAGYRYLLFSETTNASGHKAGHFDALIGPPPGAAANVVISAYNNGKTKMIEKVLEFLGKPLSGGGDVKSNVEAIIAETTAAATAAGLLKGAATAAAKKTTTGKGAVQGRINSMKGAVSKKFSKVKGALTARRSRPNVVLNILGELVYNDTKADEDNRTFSGVPFTERYFYASNEKDTSPGEAGEAWGIFAKFFMSGSMFDPDDPKMPCSLEERYFLMKGLQKRRDKLLVEVDAELRSGVQDSMQIRAMMERIVKIGVMLDELHDAEGDYCLDLDTDGQLISSKRVGANEEGVQALLRQVIFLFLQAEKPVAEFKSMEAMPAEKFIELLSSKPEIGNRAKFSEFMDKYTGDVPPALFDTLELLANEEGVTKAYDRAFDSRFGQLYEDLKVELQRGVIKEGTNRKTRFDTKIAELENPATNVSMNDKIKGLLLFMIDELNAITAKRKLVEKDLEESRKENLALTASIAALQKDLAIERATGASLAADLATRNRELEEAKRGSAAEIARITGEKAAVEAQLAAARTRIEELGRELEARNAAVRAAEAATLAKQGELTACNEEQARLRAALAASQATITQLGQEKAAVEEARKAQEERAKKAEGDLAKATADAAAAAAAAAEAARVAAAAIAEEQRKVREAEAEVARLRAELEALKASSAAEGESGKAAVAAAAAAARAAEDAQREATERAADIERRSGENVKAAEARAAAAEKAKGDAEKAAGDARAAAEAAKKDAAERIAAAEKAKGDAQAAAAAAGAAAKAAEEKAAAATAAAAAAATKQAEAEKRAEDCGKALAAAQAQLGQLEAARAALQAERDALAAEVASLKSQKAELEGQLRAKIEELKASATANAALQAEINRLNAQLADLRRQLEDCEGLRAALDAKQGELDAQLAENQRLRDELAAANAQAAAAREEAAAANRDKGAAEAAAAAATSASAAAAAAAEGGRTSLEANLSAALRDLEAERAGRAAAEGRIAAAEDAAARAAGTRNAVGLPAFQTYLQGLAQYINGDRKDMPIAPAGIDEGDTRTAIEALGKMRDRISDKIVFTRPICYLSYFASFFLQLYFFVTDAIQQQRFQAYATFQEIYKAIIAKLGPGSEIQLMDTLHFLLSSGESYLLAKREHDGTPQLAPGGLVVLEEDVQESSYKRRIEIFNTVQHQIHDVYAKKDPADFDTLDTIFRSIVDGKGYSIPNVYFPRATSVPGYSKDSKLMLVYKPNDTFKEEERNALVVVKVSAKSPEYSEKPVSVPGNQLKNLLDNLSINYNQILALFLLSLRGYLMTDVISKGLTESRCRLPDFLMRDPSSFKGPTGTVKAPISMLSYSAAVATATVSSKQRQETSFTVAQVGGNLQRIRTAIKNLKLPLKKVIEKIQQDTNEIYYITKIKERLSEAEQKDFTREDEINKIAEQTTKYSLSEKQELQRLLA